MDDPTNQYQGGYIKYHSDRILLGILIKTSKAAERLEKNKVGEEYLRFRNSYRPLASRVLLHSRRDM